MSQSRVSKSGFRARLFVLVAIVSVFIMTSCCPPALMEHPVEKNDKQVVAEKK